MESFESGCRVLIIHFNFDWKSAQITIFRLTYGYSIFPISVNITLFEYF